MNTAPLLCPLCGQPLGQVERALRCPQGHSFDLAREGYCNLLPVNAKHAKHPGDDKTMVRARRAFLAGGYYRPFAQALAALCQRYAAGPAPHILDAGCGEGYYDRCLLQRLPAAQLLGYDISKPAVQLAARALPEASYFVASSNAIPVATGWAELLVNVFSPMAAPEFARVLRPGGVLLYAVPSPRHLMGLKQVLYERPYENQVRRVEYPGFALLAREEVAGSITVTGEQVQNLFAMTPYYWKTPRGGAERLAALDALTTEIGFSFLVYRRQAADKITR